MSVSITQEIKVKGQPNITVSVSFENHKTAVEEFNKALSLLTQTEDKAPQVDTLPNEEKKAPPKKKAAKHEALELNTKALQLLEKMGVLIPHFNKKHPLDIAKELGFSKLLAEMTAEELKAVVDLAHGTLMTFAAANEDARSYLYITDVIDASQTLEELEQRKEAIPNTYWQSISTRPDLFEAAKRYFESKKKCLDAAKVIMAA